jgi:cation-transporting ATPase 13A1
VPLSLHTYVWPFAVIWPIFLRYYLSEDLYNKHIGGQEWTFVWCGAIITAQSLVWLSTNWNVNLKSVFTSVKATKVADAKLIKVIPVTNAGSAEICKIIRDNVSLSRLSKVEEIADMSGWWQAKYFVSFSEAPIPL